MAFRKKAEVILRYQPHILIVPECECPERCLFPPSVQQPTDRLWYGTNCHKGLGIFSYGDFRCTEHGCHHPDFKLVVPLSVTDGRTALNLLAIWANNPIDKDGRYIEQVWKAVQHYDALLTGQPVLLVGDFNSNSIWDHQHRLGSHSAVVKKLAEKGIHSLYHVHHRQEQGQEVHPTFYLYRQKEKAYHIDYCFGSADIVQRLVSVEVGEHEEWMKWSDHVPVIVTLDDF